MEVRGGLASNSVNFASLLSSDSAIAATIRLGSGNDVIQLGSASLPFGLTRGSLVIDGGARNNTLLLRDESLPVKLGCYIISANEVLVQNDLGSVLNSVVHRNSNQVTLNASQDHDYLFMYSTAEGTRTTINANGGVDEVIFSDLDGTMNSIRGEVAFNGRAGD